MTTWLSPAHLVLSIVILVWDIVLAGRIAQLRQASRGFAAVCGLSALLLLQALLLHLASSTLITGRAVEATDWFWPFVLVLFAVQAIYAVVRRLVNPFIGLPIASYNIVVATIGVLGYLVAHGVDLPAPLTAFMSMQSVAMTLITGSAAVVTPFYLMMPMVAPAFPALRALTASFRVFMALLAMLWLLVLFVIGLRGAVIATRSYGEHAEDRLRERPRGDFAIGLKILPDVAGSPSSAAATADLQLVDSLDVDAVGVVIVPGAGRLAVDSVGKLLRGIRGDSTIVVVSLGYRGKLVPRPGGASLDEAARLASIDYIVRQLRPTILIPAEDPYGVGTRLVGSLPVARWQRYITNAADVARKADPRVRIGVSISRYHQADSALYAWAAAKGSPVDVVGFSFFPSPRGLDEAESYQRAADRWMAVMPPVKDHWVFAVAGYPLAYGERSQQMAVWHTLSWATDKPAIKGAMVYEAGDYGLARGLRSPAGRLRPAALAIRRAIRGLKESISDP